VAGVFADRGGAWQAAGPVLPAGFGGDQVQVLGLARTVLANTVLANTVLANAVLANTVLANAGGGNAALLAAGTSLLAAWSDGGRWTVSAPVAAAGDGPGDEQGVRASGFGPGGSVWVLLGGGRAETIGGPGGSWRALPGLPAGTATLAPGSGAAAYDALAVAGSRLTVWRLTAGAWDRVQVINVPITYGSSG
jgi:hypothetical protein